MKLHYKGKYNLDPESLPVREHEEGAVQLREAQDSRKLAVTANIIATVMMIPMLAGVFLRCGLENFSLASWLGGCALAFVCMIPHEFVHAICFHGDVELYTNLKQGMLFIIGTEDMSKERFVFMSLLPNIIFGLLPYLAAMIRPQLMMLGVMGALAFPMGAGDYYNVFNALTQMPKGARTYMSGFHSYWYQPKN